MEKHMRTPRTSPLSSLLRSPSYGGQAPAGYHTPPRLSPLAPRPSSPLLAGLRGRQLPPVPPPTPQKKGASEEAPFQTRRSKRDYASTIAALRRLCAAPPSVTKPNANIAIVPGSGITWKRKARLPFDSICVAPIMYSLRFLTMGYSGDWQNFQC